MGVRGWLAAVLAGLVILSASGQARAGSSGVGSNATTATADFAAETGWLGVSIADPSPEDVKRLKLNRRGALITDLFQGGPAEAAGLRAGDLIVGVNGTDVGDTASATKLLDKTKPGDVVSVTYIRQGQEQRVALQLESNPLSWLGLRAKGLEQDQAEQLGIPGGVLVTRVRPGSPLAIKGVAPDDVLLRIAAETSVQLTSMKDLVQFLREVGPGSLVRLFIQKSNKGQVFVAVRLEGRVRAPGPLTVKETVPAPSHDPETPPSNPVAHSSLEAERPSPPQIAARPHGTASPSQATLRVVTEAATNRAIDIICRLGISSTPDANGNRSCKLVTSPAALTLAGNIDELKLLGADEVLVDGGGKIVGGKPGPPIVVKAPNGFIVRCSRLFQLNSSYQLTQCY